MGSHQILQSLIDGRKLGGNISESQTNSRRERERERNRHTYSREASKSKTARAKGLTQAGHIYEKEAKNQTFFLGKNLFQLPRTVERVLNYI